MQITKTRSLLLAALCSLGALAAVAPQRAEAQRGRRGFQFEVRPNRPHREARFEFPRRQFGVRRVPDRRFEQRVFVPAPRPARFFVRTAPPPMPRYVRPSAPVQNAVWCDGHWTWNGVQYVWVEGRWEQPRQGYVYVQPQWQQNPSGWYFVDGRWEQSAQAPVYVQPSGDADLINACAQATIGDGALQQCIQAARPLGAYAARAVLACNEEVVGDGALQQCIRAIYAVGPQTESIVRACGDATIGNGAVEQCVQIATRASYDALSIIQSCANATIGEGEFQQCLQMSVR